MRRAALAALLLSGCNLFSEPQNAPGTCTRDQDCVAGQRCFVDGCGKLPDDMLAEVTTSLPGGVSSVDLAVGPAMANLPLVLPDAQLLSLALRRGGGAYPGSVQLLASGQSTLLAGVSRAFRRMAQRCCELLRRTTSPEVREQLLLWAADFNADARSAQAVANRRNRLK